MAADPMVDRRRRFSVEEYERMGEVGIFDPADRMELLDGEIVLMSPIGPKHAGVVNRISTFLIQRISDRFTVIVQNPVRLPPRSEPQPDVMVARYRRDFYESAHPTAEDLALVIEVSDTSLRTDRTIKLPIYARQGVVEVWIVDLAARVVHVHTDPSGDQYRTVRTLAGDQPLEPTAVADLTLTVADILGG